MWPPDRFRAVLEAYLRVRPNCFAFVVGGSKAPVFEALASAARILDCARLPLATSCALVAAADFFLGVDSAMLHVADFARVPSVALFGTSDPNEFGPLFADHEIVRGAGTMESISEYEVVAALENVAARNGARRRDSFAVCEVQTSS